MIVLLFLWFLVVVGTSIWASVDANSQAINGNPIGPFGPGGWLVACLLLWIVFFPVYLIVRASSPNKTEPVLTRVANQIRAPLPGGLATEAPPQSIADELSKFGELHKTGLMSEEEFEAQKARLLGLAGNGLRAPMATAPAAPTSQPTSNPNIAPATPITPSARQAQTDPLYSIADRGPSPVPQVQQVDVTQWVCQRCGATLREGAAFCTSCGDKVTG